MMRQAGFFFSLGVLFYLISMRGELASSHNFPNFTLTFGDNPPVLLLSLLDDRSMCLYCHIFSSFSEKLGLAFER
jgi:hypothetical protein